MMAVQPNFNQKFAQLNLQDEKQSIEPSTHGSMQVSESVGLDREHNGASKQTHSVSSRKSHNFGAPADSMTREGMPQQDVLNQYLEETGLLEVFKSWTVLLAGLADLPYSPYPTLVWYARRLAERFHLFDSDDNDLYSNINGQVYKMGSCICRTHDNPPWWGLGLVLRVVNTKYLSQYHRLVTSMSTDEVYQESGSYSFVMHKVIPVLVGSCVFGGSLYPDVCTIQVRMEYGIAGPHFDGAAQMFSESILASIVEPEDENEHMFLGVTVPFALDSSDVWMTEEWSYDRVLSNKNEFLSCVKLAALNHQIVCTEYMFNLDPERRILHRGQKQFNLNFILISQQGTRCLSPLPYLSLYEGVFFSHSTVKEYLAWFEHVQLPEHPPTFREPTTSTHKRTGSGLFSLGEKSKGTAVPVSNHASNTQLSQGVMSSTTESTASFDPGIGPYDKTALDLRRSYLKSEVASLAGEENLFPMLHYIVLLLLLDRDDEASEEGLLEVMRILNSSLYKLYLVMEKNSLLQDLVTSFADKEGAEFYIVQDCYLDYRKSLQQLFCSEMQERSREFSVAGKVLLEQLDSITIQSTEHLLTTILPLYPRSYFPPLNSRSTDLSRHNVTHGAEVPTLLSQGKMYLNKEQAMQTAILGKSVAGPSVILKYFIDTRFDQVLHEFLGRLLSGSSFPPNPYPRLVSHLREAAVSMELFGERQERLVSSLLPNSAQLVDSLNHVYHSPGCQAYGALSAVIALDSKSFNELRTALRLVTNTISNRITEVGFKATIGAAITGFSPLYGRMLPYLHEVELEEHYFIKGPRDAQPEVIQYFNKLVFDHLEGLSELDNPALLFVGIFLGNTGNRRTFEDILPPLKKRAFLAQLTATVKSKQPVFMKAYVQMGWRFVMVNKTFLLHYIEGAFTGYHRFYSQAPLRFYQNVFSSQESAALFAGACGAKDKTDPCTGMNVELGLMHVDHVIQRAFSDGKLLDGYRWLLTRSFMTKDSSCIADIWRMAHSSAAQLEYLQTLNATIQSLVYEELSRTFTAVHQDSSSRNSLLDVTVLKKMFDVYSSKLHRVLELGTCMAPSGLLSLIQDKLVMVLDTETSTDTALLQISKKTPQILQEINELLQPLLDLSASDVHQVCTKVDNVLEKGNNLSAMDY